MPLVHRFGKRAGNARQTDVMSEMLPTHAAPISLRITDPLIFPLVPAAARPVVEMLWQLDARLHEMAVSGKEPALRQIRLRWWADQLAAMRDGVTSPEPLLAAVGAELLPHVDGAALAALAEDWGAAAVAEAGDPTIDQPGAQLFALTRQLLGGDADAGDAGRLWAMACRLTNGDEAVDWAAAVVVAERLRWAGLPRALAALTALSRTVVLRRGARRRGREQMLLLRVGLFGR